ncbi:hypothetical protein GOP47_0021197 [Adiantum capillus-veneris]|uniref:t-SNARE coiled-coil homology domain-containing protein n=1 Tax=Adiantum capillus-veneris TaxID=13818 RepID=A0A9D4UBF8_ADICA|nr:hypothetical protein GOP47_0021197 [Adiantum capillus-veneris]
MAQNDSWMREFEDAVRLAEDIAARIAERNSAAPVGSGSRAADNSRLVSATRRKITMLGTRLDSLQSLLSNPSLTKSLNEKDLSKRQDMVLSLRSRMNQMSNSLNSSQASNRSNLLGQDGRGEPKENNRTTGLDNSGIVGLQRQIMREQDDDLLKLEETVTSTKHIALAVNEELDLHTKLLDNLDDDTDRTNTRLKAMQRRLGVLGKKASSGCSVMCLILMVLLIVILVLVIIALIRYL